MTALFCECHCAQALHVTSGLVAGALATLRERLHADPKAREVEVVLPRERADCGGPATALVVFADPPLGIVLGRSKRSVVTSATGDLIISCPVPEATAPLTYACTMAGMAAIGYGLHIGIDIDRNPDLTPLQLHRRAVMGSALVLTRRGSSIFGNPVKGTDAVAARVAAIAAAPEEEAMTRNVVRAWMAHQAAVAATDRTPKAGDLS